MSDDDLEDFPPPPTFRVKPRAPPPPTSPTPTYQPSVIEQLLYRLKNGFRKYKRRILIACGIILIGILIILGILLFKDKKFTSALLILGGNDSLENRSVDVITVNGLCGSHSVPELPEGRRGGAVWLAQSPGFILFCGGLDNLNQVQKNCWILTTTSSVWLASEPLLEEVAFAAYASLHDRFFLIGGRTSLGVTSSVQIFSKGTWKYGPPLLSNRYGGCAVAWNNYLISVGGTGRLGEKRDIFVYSLQHNKWKVVSPPDSFPGQSTGTCLMIPNLRELKIFGGTGDSNIYSIFFLKGDSVSIKISPFTHKIDWQPHAAMLEESIVLVGGRGEMGKSNTIWSLEKERWRKVGNLTLARDQMAGVVLDKEWRHFLC